MLEGLFRRRWALKRIRANPIASVLERYVEYLVGRGHLPETSRGYVCVVEHFGRWLGRRPVSRIMVRRFIRRHLPVCRCRMPACRNLLLNRAALNRLLDMLGIAPDRAGLPRGLIGDLLRRYQESLVTVRGLAAAEIHRQLVAARTMVMDLHIRRTEQFSVWTPELISDYVTKKARGYKPATGKGIATRTRSFLRFLLQEGLIHRDLSAAVPRFALWRLASLPDTLQKEDLIRLTRAADIRTPVGLRDRAILLCMSELGLRASDVAGLELGGVDLTAKVLRLRHCKERELAAVPITRKLADALAAYLYHGRLASSAQSVFVMHRAPIGRSLSPINIRDIVLRLADRAGLGHRVGGTHILRHSVASRMLGAGANLKQIADLLGHQSINTTMIYAKVDFAALSQVALPWPGTKEVQR